MKKVWIASILATLMLTVPLTSVVGASDTVEDCNCNPAISDFQVVRIERLLDRLESRINFILLRYGHIPEIREKCEGILDVINSDGLNEILCDILDRIFIYLFSLKDIMSEELWFILFWIPGFILFAIWIQLMCFKYP